MAKKAICVGINDYPFDDMDLKGCVNDARAWADLLIRHYDFDKADVRLLLDSEATKANIMASLKKMIEGSVEGDILVFINSSHGTYLIDDERDEPDKYDEAICPYDTSENLIVDDELRELFSQLSAGVNLTVISDSCHSGTLLKAMLPGSPDQRRVRFLNPALIGKVVISDIYKAKPKGMKINLDSSMRGETLLSACKSTQYASEALIEGLNHGAMTYYALNIIKEADYNITLQELQKKLQMKLEAEGYEQDPQLEGKEENMNKLLFSNKTRECEVEVKGMSQDKIEKIRQEALQRYLKLEDERNGIREALPEPYNDAEKAARMNTRRSIINIYDGMGDERLINKSDLFPISYFNVGLKAAKPVCRISIRDRIGRIQGYGTGFMVSSSLIMTNNHVLDNEQTALDSIIEFNYQDDENFIPLPIVSFRLDPKRLFITDEKLDFTLVAVKETSNDGKKLADFGFLPLLSVKGKILEGEYVSIIQHPNGGPKAVTVRENEVKYMSQDYIHYITDTEPGSSGSPVFNDQWIVVAIHHAGVPDPNDSTKWIANEGIRISSIADYVAKLKSSLDASVRALLDESLLNVQLQDTETDEVEVGRLGLEHYRDVSGYDKAFLDGFEIPLPKLKEDLESDIAYTVDGSKKLDYTHFSIVMSKSRRLAYFTAVNIDGKNFVKIDRSRDKWYFDPRISEEFQCGPSLYNKNELDRGHLVRRMDPDWGMDAYKADEDTFHFTNCSPQHKELNQKTWLNLEDYILKNAGKYGIKVTVFTGPVFRADDMVYRGEFKIPAEFWKVVAIKKDDDTLSATAYLQTQKNLITNLEFAYGKYKTYQVPVLQIEALTNLDFGKLREHDPIANIEEFGASEIEGPEDIRL